MFKYGYHQNILMDGDHDTPEYVRFFFNILMWIRAKYVIISY